MTSAQRPVARRSATAVVDLERRVENLEFAQFLVAGALLQMPCTVVRRSTSLSANNVTDTGIPFDVEEIDTLGAWSAGTPQFLIIPYNGVYAVSGFVLWNAGAGSMRQATIRKNGVSSWVAATTVGNSPLFSVFQAPSTVAVMLNEGDFLDLTVFQDSGGALNVAANAQLGLTLVSTV